MASKFTPEVRETVLKALRDNPSIPSAASKAAISPVTLNRWLQQGEEGDPKFAEFAPEATEARRTMKDSIVAALHKTATDELHPQQTKAAHLLLTNLYPTEFANVKHTVAHKPEDREIDLSTLSTEELRAFHRMLKRVMKGDDSNSEQKPVPVLDVTSQG